MSVSANIGRKVAVIGGGIGGCAAALALARTGAEVDIYEKHEKPSEFGGGVQVTPNGFAVLEGLGLAREVRARAVAAQALVPVDGLRGQALARFDLSARPGYHFFYRPDLLALLTEACAAHGVVYHGGVAARALAPDGSVEMADGKMVAADIVVGADGLGSCLRAGVTGATEPFFTGQVAYRAIVEGVETAAEARIWMLPGRHVVTYPLAGGRLNIVAVREQADWAEEGWSHRAEPEELCAVFADAAPALRGILDRVREVRRWGLFRHPVAERWHRGGVALIGDAAHPTLPFLAQGANLALEDAYVLATETGANPDLAQALGLYQARRRPRVERAIAEANANARRYHLRGPARSAAHLALRLAGLAPGAFMGRYDWLYGEDVTKRPSWAGVVQRVYGAAR